MTCLLSFFAFKRRHDQHLDCPSAYVCALVQLGPRSAIEGIYLEVEEAKYGFISSTHIPKQETNDFVNDFFWM